MSAAEFHAATAVAHGAAPYSQFGNLLVHAEHEPILRRAGLCSIERLMSTPGAARLDKPGLPRWRERLMLEIEGRRYYLKRYTGPPLLRQVRRWLGGYSSEASIEWGWLAHLEALKIPAPLGVAYGAVCRGPREIASAVLAAEVPGVSLERWVGEQCAAGGIPLAVRRALSRDLAALVAAFHGHGLVHRDLYLAHVFMEASGGSFRLALIDLQRVMRRAPEWRHRRWRIKDLASLNYSTPPAAATRADRVRWLQTYLGRRLGPRDLRLARRIAAKTRRIARHSTRRG